MSSKFGLILTAILIVTLIFWTKAMLPYDDIGLNSKLISNDSLMAKKNDFVSGYDIGSDYDRAFVQSYQLGGSVVKNVNIGTAVIGTANIGTLSFNEIKGGTGIFGGTNSGSGVVSVLNQSGVETVRLDSSGIKVINGSIVVTNSTGGTIIDTNGLTSTGNNNFENNEISTFTFGDLTATTDTDLIGTITTSNFPRIRRCQITAKIVFRDDPTDANPFNGNINAGIILDGVSQTRAFQGPAGGATTLLTSWYTVSFSQFFDFSSGTHTIKLAAKLQNNSANYRALINEARIGFICFGR